MDFLSLDPCLKFGGKSRMLAASCSQSFDNARRSLVMENLRELLVEELKDLYSAEKQIVKALPKIIRGAASQELKAAVTEHLEVAKTQVLRLEEVFGVLGQKPKAKHCKGMEGLLAEGTECKDRIRFGDAGDLFESFTAQSLANFSEREPLWVRQAQPGRQMRSQDAILRSQILICSSNRWFTIPVT